MRDFFQKNVRTNEIKNEIDDIKNGKIKLNEKIFNIKQVNFDFQQCATIRSFGESIYFSQISIIKAGMDQNNVLENVKKINDKSRPKTKEGEDKKQNTFDNVSALYEGQELTLDAFKIGIFPIKEKQGKELKRLTPKQMLQRLPIALALVKAGNTSGNLINEIRQIKYSLY